MIKPVTIAKKTSGSQSRAQDFSFLRQHAIELIQRMCGGIWTDYNLHDPGVTTLEQLCFAITDLAYRTDVPIEDLLADANGIINYRKNSFYKRDEILFSGPVTINDFRKVLIDEIDEIDNIWLEPVISAFVPEGIRGVLKPYVQINSAAAQKISQDANAGVALKKKIRDVFMSKRNLCEDLYFNVNILKALPIVIGGEIVIDGDYQPEKVLAEIYAQIELLFSEKIKYYTPEELLATGMSVEDIYSGPKLKKGVILDTDLGERKQIVDPAEISQFIMRVEGVQQVNQLTLAVEGEPKTAAAYQLDDNSFPMLAESSWSSIRLVTNRYQINVNKPLFDNLLKKTRAIGNRLFVSAFYNSRIADITGTYRDPTQYYSIQRSFPLIYGIGPNGLPKAEQTDKRMGEIRQLKGYLLFFEQVMANYLAILANVEDNFAFQPGNNTFRSRSNQPLFDVPDLRVLLKSYTDKKSKLAKSNTQQKDEEDLWRDFMDDAQNGYRQRLNQLAGAPDDHNQKRLRQLDHMLARFNEPAEDFPVRLFKQLYKPEIQAEFKIDEVKWKSYLLRHIVAINYGRTRGYDFLNDKASEFNFEKRLRVLLYMPPVNIYPNLVKVFEDKKLSFENVAPADNVAAVEEPPAADQTYSSLFLTKEEYALLKDQKQIVDMARSSTGVQFLDRDESLFLEAISLDNYRIVPYTDTPGTGGSLLLFKYRKEAKWQIIGRFEKEEDCIAGVKQLLGYFRNLSVNSEGLYVVEHILLRPPLSSKSFKFQLMSEKEEKIARLKSWMSFAQREDVLSRFSKAIDNDDEQQLRQLIAEQLDVLPSLQGDPFLQIQSLLKDSFGNPDGRICLTVKGKGEAQIPEPFFGYRITVVLPNWPARFQDESFQGYMKNLIFGSVPAHVRVAFEWLSIGDMKRFEDNYTSFKECFKADNVAEKQQYADEIISMFTHS